MSRTLTAQVTIHTDGNLPVKEVLMFINEQHSYLELRREFVESEHAVWSPVSNRHCCWTFAPNPYAKRLWG